MAMYKLTKKEAEKYFKKGADIIVCNKPRAYAAVTIIINKKNTNFREFLENFKNKYNLNRPYFFI